MQTNTKNDIILRMDTNTPTPSNQPETQEPTAKDISQHIETTDLSPEDTAQQDAAMQADAEKAEEIRQGLTEGTEQGEHPEDPVVKTAKEKYRNEYLDTHHENLPEHLEELIKGYPSHGNPQSQAEKAVAFEATMDYCIENGRLKVETIMRAMLLGVAKGIIRHEHLGYYQRYINQFPPLEFLLDINQKDFAKMAKDFQGSYGKKKFEDFYWEEILTDTRVTNRIKKSAPTGVWDHDAVAAIAPGGDAEVAKLISTRPEAQTSIENAYAGSLKWLRVNLKSSQKNAPQYVRNMLGFFLMSHGITSNRAYKNVEPIRGGKYILNDETRQEIPRMTNQLFGRKMNLGQIDDAIWSLIQPLEPTLFTLLKKPDLHLEELQDYVQKKYNFQIASFDDFYDRIDEILKRVLPDQKAKKGFFARLFGSVE